MILTDDEIRKAAEFAAEQMWPESGYVGWTEDDAVFHRKFIEACFEKLRAGVELPDVLGDGFTALVTVGDTPSLMEQKRICVSPIAVCSLESARQYGAAQRLAGRERAIEECAAECLALHANGNYKHDTREDCHDAIRALAASPQEQT